MAKTRKYRVPVNVEKFGFWLEPALVERARNAVYGTPGGLTLSGLVAAGLEAQIAKLERKFNDGQPFPKHGKLPRGSRPKT